MAAVTAPRPVRVTIDRLVLHGVDRADAAAVQRALAAELGRRLAAAGPDLSAQGDLRLTVPAEPSAAGMGRAAAGAVVDSLTAPGGRR